LSVALSNSSGVGTRLPAGTRISCGSNLFADDEVELLRDGGRTRHPSAGAPAISIAFADTLRS